MIFGKILVAIFIIFSFILPGKEIYKNWQHPTVLHRSQFYALLRQETRQTDKTTPVSEWIKSLWSTISIKSGRGFYFHFWSLLGIYTHILKIGSLSFGIVFDSLGTLAKARRYLSQIVKTPQRTAIRHRLSLNLSGLTPLLFCQS